MSLFKLLIVKGFDGVRGGRRRLWVGLPAVIDAISSTKRHQ